MFSFFPTIAHAATSAGATAALNILKVINKFIINPIIALLFAVAILSFLWGMANYVRKAENENERKKAQDTIMYSVIGLVIMVSVYGIMRFIMNTLGVTGINPEQGIVDITI